MNNNEEQLEALNVQKKAADDIAKAVGMPTLAEMLGGNPALKGRSDCPYCEGSGMKYEANGEDDFDKVICDCVNE